MIHKKMKTKDPMDAVLLQIQENKSRDGSGHFMDREETEIFGEFDGHQGMRSESGRCYPVPHNYASRSMLLEGDKMKLMITPDGEFIFKQIGPVERKKFIGMAKVGPDGDMWVLNPQTGKCYKVLLASATFHKVCEGDEVTATIPKYGETEWCALECVIFKRKTI